MSSTLNYTMSYSQNDAQCTNRYCRSTIFHSPSLPFAIATAMVDKMKSNPGFLYTADMFKNLPTISQSQRVILENGTELPMMVHQKTEIQANLCAKGGIYCRNPLCRTQSGERCQGCVNCRELLCQSCCASAARRALADHQVQPPCSVGAHARAVNPG